MKKRICLGVCMAFLLLTAVGATEIPALDPARPCSLTLHYDREGTACPGLEIRVFRVAAFSEDGSYALTGDFAGYPVQIHDITAQSQWQEAARTLAAYAQADGLAATATGQTDETGTVRFEGLSTGLYLVMDAWAEMAEGRFRFENFLIFLPTPDENGEPDYDLEAEPKPGTLTSISRYKVVKLWKDSADPRQRPVSITVEILRNGELFETVTLNEENNWTHTWESDDPDSRWTVAEREVPPGYTVAVEEKGDTFFITNTLPGIPEEPPETGDPACLGLWMVLALTSGGLLPLLRKGKCR